MKLYRYAFRLCCLLLFFVINTLNSRAQNSSHELWLESDIWYRLNSSWRLSSFIAITKYSESKDRDLNFTLQADRAWGHTKNPFLKRLQDENRAMELKAWLVRSGYMRGQSLGDHGGNYTENMALAEIHKRIPLRGDGLLSARFRTDLRWIGQSQDLSYRLRYRMMLEKEYKVNRSSIVPYVNAEPFWDSRYTKVNRFRLIGGATVAWGKLVAIEGNFTYQYDSESSFENVYALNIILHIFFERKAAEVKTESGRQPQFDIIDFTENHK
jgi:hypothetical protein